VRSKGFCTYYVLKVLEEAGVKIDYIGGTSMRGYYGLYASDTMQPKSIPFKQLILVNCLMTIFLALQKFYEKRNEELYAIVLPSVISN
jgi:NTE family protein